MSQVHAPCPKDISKASKAAVLKLLMDDDVRVLIYDARGRTHLASISEYLLMGIYAKDRLIHRRAVPILRSLGVLREGDYRVAGGRNSHMAEILIPRSDICRRVHEQRMGTVWYFMLLRECTLEPPYVCMLWWSSVATKLTRSITYYLFDPHLFFFLCAGLRMCDGKLVSKGVARAHMRFVQLMMQNPEVDHGCPYFRTELSKACVKVYDEHFFTKGHEYAKDMLDGWLSDRLRTSMLDEGLVERPWQGLNTGVGRRLSAICNARTGTSVRYILRHLISVPMLLEGIPVDGHVRGAPV